MTWIADLWVASLAWFGMFVLAMGSLSLMYVHETAGIVVAWLLFHGSFVGWGYVLWRRRRARRSCEG